MTSVTRQHDPAPIAWPRSTPYPLDAPDTSRASLLGSTLVGAGIGAAVGALGIIARGGVRSSDAHTAATLLRSMGLATAVGAAGGLSFAGIDHALGGAMTHQIRTHLPWELAPVLSRPTELAWLPASLLKHQTAVITATTDRFGLQPDGPMDAYRHAAITAVIMLDALRHGMEPEAAAELARSIGEAHERRGPDDLRRTMDLHNNEVGIAAVGSGRLPDGSVLDAASLTKRLDGAMQRGDMLVADLDATDLALRPTTPADLPPDKLAGRAPSEPAAR